MCKVLKSSGKKGSGKSGGHKEDPRESRNAWDTKDRVGRPVETYTSRQSVDGRDAGVEEEDGDCRRVGGQLESEEDGDVGGVCRWERCGTPRKGRRHQPPRLAFQEQGT